jgi:hypothetical protein
MMRCANNFVALFVSVFSPAGGWMNLGCAISLFQLTFFTIQVE